MKQDPGAAIRSLEASLSFARAAGDDALASTILLKLSGAYLATRESLKSLEAAEEGVAAARRAGDVKQEAWALDQAGNALYSMGKFTSALDNFLSSLALMRQTGDRYGEAVALKDVGIICKYLRRYDEAFSRLNEALEIFRELNDAAGTLSTLHNIGVGYALLGADRLALEAFEEGLSIARENNDFTGACHVLIRIGYLVRDPELALDYLSQALDLAEQLKLHDLQIEVLNGMSAALAKTGQWDRAVQAQKRALEINTRLNSRMAVEINGLGHLFLERDPAVAADYFQRSLAAALRESDSPLLISPHHGLAQAYRRLGELDLAVEHYQRAVDGIESIRTQLASDQYRATFLRRHQDVYEGLIDTLMQRHESSPGTGDDRRAFAVLERARARSLVEAIAEARLGAEDQPDQDLDRREKELNVRLAELQKRLMQTGVNEDERLDLQQRLSLAEQEFERLKVEVKLRKPHAAPLSYPSPISIEEAQGMLDDRTAMVAYVVTAGNVFAFVITTDTFYAERLPVPAHVMRARVQNYVDLIVREDGGWREVSRRLYDDLVAPIRKLLPAGVSRLVLVPDDALHYLAFETLVGGADLQRETGQTPSRYLLEDFAISYAPSATVLAELTESASASQIGERANIAVFADPAVAPMLLAANASATGGTVARSLYAEEGLQVTRIPFSAAEARAIEQYAGSRGKIYTGAEASESRFKADQLDRFRVLHFATHGLISQHVPARSALVLAPGVDEDGFLQVREIYELKLESDLVVLSACQTARGQLVGDGVRGLAQAFLHAGAKSVVASLWDVNDERTASFMDSFYRHLAEGKSKAEALRAAKLEHLRQRSTSSPRLWAAFILIGEAQGGVPIKMPNRLSVWWPALIALTIASLAVVLFLGTKRKRRADVGRTAT
jgi:CHAT domain-containing protein/Tfp pilus assembly protein PilF